jgi:hypothetical protein
MNTKIRNTVALAALVAAAFLAGEADLLSNSGGVALAGPQTDAQGTWDQEMTPEMMAWMKASQPGEHHKALNAMIGTWEGEYHVKMDPEGEAFVSNGKVTREWLLDGRFVLEHVKADSPMGPYEAYGVIGYDNVDGVYQSMWIESTSTAIMNATGTMDPDDHTMRFSTTMRDPASGKLMMSESKYTMGDGHEKMVGWTTMPNGKRYKSFWGEAKRVDSGKSMSKDGHDQKKHDKGMHD